MATRAAAVGAGMGAGTAAATTRRTLSATDPCSGRCAASLALHMSSRLFTQVVCHAAQPATQLLLCDKHLGTCAAGWADTVPSPVSCSPVGWWLNLSPRYCRSSASFARSRPSSSLWTTGSVVEQQRQPPALRRSAAASTPAASAAADIRAMYTMRVRYASSSCVGAAVWFEGVWSQQGFGGVSSVQPLVTNDVSCGLPTTITTATITRRSEVALPDRIRTGLDPPYHWVEPYAFTACKPLCWTCTQ